MDDFVSKNLIFHAKHLYPVQFSYLLNVPDTWILDNPCTALLSVFTMNCLKLMS